jgi:hypothetical protein
VSQASESILSSSVAAGGTAIDDQDPVETLAAHGSGEALGECVRPRCSERRADHLDRLVPEDLVEGTRRAHPRLSKLAVEVVDEDLRGTLDLPRLDTLASSNTQPDTRTVPRATDSEAAGSSIHPRSVPAALMTGPAGEAQ